MAVNKVIYGDRTLVDLTEDSVNEDNLLEGETAHDASGNPVTGTAKQGHIVQDTDGTDMPQEENLQFVGVYTEDDATNDRTKVNIVREMTSAQMEALTPAQKKGFIRTTDEPDNPYAKSVVSMQLLWENPNPTSAFASQTITLASGDYDLLMVISEYDTAGRISNSLVVPKGSGMFISATTYASNVAISLRRVVTYVSDTSLSVGDAKNQNTTDNTVVIPIAIYGIKL